MKDAGYSGSIMYVFLLSIASLSAFHLSGATKATWRGP
jgi:hypothetical protein